MLTATRNSQQRQSLLVLQMVNICVVTLSNVSPCSSNLNTTAVVKNVIETTNSQNWSNRILRVWAQLLYDDLARKVTHKASLTGWEYRKHTSLIWHEVIIGLKCRILPHFMIIKVRTYLTAYFTTEDARIQFSPPVNYLYGCQVAPVTVGPSDIILPERHHSRTP